ncbi:MAG: hypothetical protein E6J95_04545 [Methanobacteriota archaeon]|nr:MAG: hypothetical protein E6J95_04545 [Euryarchaeota archaeon]
MAGLLQLARPINCVMSALGVGIGGVVAARSGAWGEFAGPLALAGAAAASFTAGGNALNDLYDRETDRVNHPDRPLPSGSVTLREARAFTAAAFVVTAVLAALVNVFAFAVVILNIALMVLYEAALKAQGAPGNLVIAYLVGSLFLFAGVSVFRSSTAPLVRTSLLAALAFFTTVGREITKDIQDVRGDVDRRTLPRRIGIRPAGWAAALSFLVGVLLSLAPLPLHVLSVAYAALVIPADGMFIYAALHSAANPARSQRVAKYGMIVALAAFLAGALA